MTSQNAQAFPGFVPVYYYPQESAGNIQADEDLAKKLQEEELQAAGEVEEATPRRWWNLRSYQRVGENERSCAWTDDGRPLGSLTNFIQGLVFGTLFPILALLTIFGFETSKLTRTGALFGTSNFFFIIASCLLYIRVGFPLDVNDEVHRIFFINPLIPLFIGIIFLAIAKRSVAHFMFVYKTRENKHESEEVKTFTEGGRVCGFVLAFFVSFFFSFVGAAIALFAGRRSLRARFGVFSGLGFSLCWGSIIHSFHGIPPVALVVGLFLIQISSIHFQRALISADAKNVQAITV